ncbi:MAG: hypothetical protein WC455_10775 [Dehalococcoidia bacterium]|jgi:hypothetical protein
MTKQSIKCRWCYPPPGSHTVFFKVDDKGQKLLVVVPKRDILPVGVLISIMKQGKFARDEFLELLTT